MAGFNLTAQLQLQAPTNTSQVVGNIKKQLSGISVNVQVKGDAGSLAKINKQMQNVNKSASASSKSVSNLNRNLSEAARRFSVITVATGTMLGLARAIKNSVGEAIAFEREMIKISQVTGKTVQNLQGLSDEVTKLSTTLGASSADLLNVSRVLAQAGFSASKTKQALDILAKTSLGATFSDIQDTTEGAIAVLRQFRKEAKAAGGDIKFLEKTMDAINSVSKKFAVESGDLITVIRRVGGVFESAGGSVNELIALFTSVRATTRESAETIATGLRTIFTRIQRTDTVDQLAALGIQLRDSQGQFVGAYEAVRRLSQGLKGLDPRDFRFSEITESLGGFRQVGKVIPLIRQFTTAQDALNVAQAASGSVTADAVTAQKSLAVQAQRVREEFSAMVRKLADSSTFRAVAKGALEMASAFIRIAEALEPLLPLLTSMIALKIGSSLAPGLGALAGVKRKSAGGRIHGYARGGFVPGSGNRDTVPAMLTPGEFVIKKSSVNKLGAGTLEAMNNNRYRTGGKQLRDEIAAKRADPTFRGKTATKGLGVLRQLDKAIENLPEDDVYGGAFLTPMSQSQDLRGSVDASAIKATFAKNATFQMLMKAKGGSKLKKAASDLQAEANTKADFTLLARSTKEGLGEKVEGRILDGVEMGVRGGAAAFGQDVGIRGASKNMSGILRDTNIDNVIGNLFEASLLRSGVPYEESQREHANDPFDFPGGMGSRSKSFQNAGELASRDTDAKTRYTASNINSFLKKVRDKKTNDLTKKLDTIISELTPDDIEGGFATRGKGADAANAAKAALKKKKSLTPAKKAYGGKIDSVPALLTPGEYVINKSAAQSIGYGNLNKMNQTGVKRFAMGGTVGWQRFAGGGKPSGKKMGLDTGAGWGSVIADLDDVAAALGKVGITAGTAAKPNQKYIQALHDAQRALEDGASQADAFDTAFDNMIDGVKEGEKAAKAEADARKASGAGDIAAMDVQAYGSEIGGAESVAVELAAGGDKTANDALADMQKQEAAAIAKKIKAADNSIGTSEALSRARQVVSQKYGGLATKSADTLKAMEEENKARKTFTQKLKGAAGKAFPTVGKVGGKIKGAAGKIGRGAESMQGAAAAAQNIAFFGATAISAAVQMSGLSDATKQATTETLGFAAGMLGVGSTVIQMLSGLATVGGSVATAKAGEAAASAAAGTADLAETGGSAVATAGDVVEGGASMAVAAPLLILIAVVGAVVLAMKWFASKAKAEADALAKGRKENLDKIGSGEGGSVQKAKDSVGAEMDLRKSAEGFDMAMYTAAAGGAAVAGSFALAGAAMGSAVPVVGTLIGALVGAAAGYWYATAEVSEAAKAEAAARQEMVLGIFDSIDTFARLSESSNKFDTAMSDLDQVKLPNTEEGKRERVKRELAITADLDTTGVNDEFDKIATVAKKAGINMGSLTEADLIEQFGEGSAELIAFQTATRASATGMESLAKKTQAARATLQKAADLEITGELTFDELIASGGQLAQAFKASQAAIRAEGQARIDKAKAEASAARGQIKAGEQKTGWFGGPTDEGTKQSQEGFAALKKAGKDEAAARNRMNQQLKDEEESLRMTAEAAKKRVEADRRAAAAAQALAEQIQRTNDFMKALGSEEFAQGQQKKGLDNKVAGLTGGDMDFSRDVEGLGGDFSMIADIEKFGKEMTVAIGDLPAGLQKEAKRQLGIVTEATEVFNEGRKRVTSGWKDVKIDKEFGDDQIKEIIKAAGLDPSKMDPDTLNQIMADIREKGKDGIDNADFDDIFEPIRQQGDAAQGSLQKINELRNNEISNYAAYLSAVTAQRDKDLKGMLEVQKVQQKGAALRAEARGTSLGAGVKETQRTDAAQLALSGTGVAAGDAAGAAAAMKDAKIRSMAIAKEIADAKKRGGEIKKLMAEEKKQQDIIKKTSAELSRLSDQSARASDIMAGIKGEQDKRDTVTGLISDFVVGSNEERGKMVEAFKGINLATSTGTLQNQSPEQRGATVALLDKLGDIEIAGTGGMTGKEVKQELVFRDAIQMGLDPAIAEKLATATSKEEQLIQALDRLTGVMEGAAQASAMADAGAGAAAGFAEGGVVYRGAGGGIFKPRGTDTVPAMLTPGEFVVKKSAVDSIGLGALQSLNRSGGGIVQYRQGGGPINKAQGQIGGGAIRIPTGDQFRKMFQESAMSIGPAGFLKVLKTVYGENVKDMVGKDAKKKKGKEKQTVTKSLQTLLRANKLDVTKLTYPDSLANYLDTVLASSDILGEANADGVTFKRINAAEGLYGKKIDVQKVKSALQSMGEYQQRLLKMSTFADSGTGDLNEKVTGAVINQATGMNPLSRLDDFRFLAASRSMRMADEIKRLQAVLAAREASNAFNATKGIAPISWVNTIDGVADTGIVAGDKKDFTSDHGDKMKKKPVKKEPASVLKAIEKLQAAGVLKMATGGSVPGISDTVPAMLTPGEFVMSKAAVQKHGIGYMKSLNKGRIPGFNRGGLVGKGAVQYKQAGGSVEGGGNMVLSLDPTNIQQVLTEFNATFSATIDNIVAPFNSVAESLNTVASAFGSMTMTHVFSGDLTLSVNIGNKDAIVAAVTEGIKPKISELITRTVDASIDELKNSAAG